MRALTDPDLKHYRSKVKQMREFEMSAPTPGAVDWREQWALEHRKQRLKESLADVAREIKRRGLCPSSEVATKKVGLHRQTVPSIRRKITQPCVACSTLKEFRCQPVGNTSSGGMPIAILSTASAFRR